MERLQRSLSERPGSLTPLEMKVEFMDQDGVLRRSSSVLKRVLTRGATVGKLEYLSVESNAADKPRSAAEVELLSARPTLLALRPTSESEVASPISREERMRRRTQFQLQLRDRKHSMLVEQNTRHQERLQLWHDAAELDPAVETTSQNTIRTPSPRAQAYVDEDGNLRRKRSDAPFAAPSEQLQSADQATEKSSPSPISLVLGSGKASRIRTSLVLEFAQNFIDS